MMLKLSFLSAGGITGIKANIWYPRIESFLTSRHMLSGPSTTFLCSFVPPHSSKKLLSSCMNSQPTPLALPLQCSRKGGLLSSGREGVSRPMVGLQPTGFLDPLKRRMFFIFSTTSGLKISHQILRIRHGLRNNH